MDAPRCNARSTWDSDTMEECRSSMPRVPLRPSACLHQTGPYVAGKECTPWYATTYPASVLFKPTLYACVATLRALEQHCSGTARHPDNMQGRRRFRSPSRLKFTKAHECVAAEGCHWDVSILCTSPPSPALPTGCCSSPQTSHRMPYMRPGTLTT
jgi:hypothetical protein